MSLQHLGFFLPTNFAAGYELAVPVSPEAPAWRAAPWRDINDWIHLANGTDDSPVFTAALAASDYIMVTPKSGGGAWTMPMSAVSSSGGGTVTVASGKTIKGLNKNAKIHLTGGNTSSNTAGFNAYGGVVDILFEDLYFYGDNGTTPGTFTYVVNKQSSAIGIWGDASLNQAVDVVTRGCTFEYLYGFPIHHVGGANTKRCHALDNVTRYCANGININCHRAIISRNSVMHSEGLEITGAGTNVTDNVILEGLGTCIAMGGAGEVQQGQLVAHNHCKPDPTDGGECLSLGDGFIDSAVIGNRLIAHFGTNYGMDFRNAFGETYQPKRNVIGFNIIRMDVGTGIGIHARSHDSLYIGNDISANTNIALQIAADNTTFVGNNLDVGSGTVRSFQTGTTSTGAAPQNILIDESNQYAPFAWFDASAGAATFRDGSYLRLTARPTMAAYLRNVRVKVTGAGAADDTYALGVQRGGSGTYVWADLVEDNTLTGSKTFDWADLATATQQSTTVTVTGAVLGDLVEGVSMSVDLAGTSLRGYVSSADTVTVYQRNDTGGNVNLASGTLRVKVRKL